MRSHVKELLEHDGTATMVPLSLLCIGLLYKKPALGAETIFIEDFKRKVHDSQNYTYKTNLSNWEMTDVFSIDLKSHKLIKNKRDLLYLILKMYEQNKKEVPNPYKKLFYDEMSNKYLRSSLKEMPRQQTLITDYIAEKIAKIWPFVIGFKDMHASENIKAAVIYHNWDRTEVLAIDNYDRMLTFSVPKAEAKNHQQVIQRCDKEIVSLSNGGLCSLPRSDFDFSSLFLSVSETVEMRHEFLNELVTEISGMKGFAAEINERRELRSTGAALIVDAFFDKLTSAQQVFQALIPKETKQLAESFDAYNFEVLSFLLGSPDGEPFADWQAKKGDAEDSFFYTGALFNLATNKAFRDNVIKRAPILPVIREITGLTKAQVDALIRFPTPKNSEQIITSYPPFDPSMIRQVGLTSYVNACKMYEVLMMGSGEKSNTKVASEVIKFYAQKDPLNFDSLRIEDYKDFIHELDKSLIEGICVEIHGRSNEVTSRFLKGILYPKKPKDLIEASKNHHYNLIHVFNDYARSNQKFTSWKPLTEHYLTDDKVLVKELTSTIDIIRQGEKQHHCVGSYVQWVLDGRILILSVETKDETLSTVELNRETLMIRQHRGAYNSEPSYEQKAIVNEFIRLNKQRIKPKDQAEYSKELHYADRNALVLNGKHPRRVFEAMSSALPKKAVAEGYDSLIQRAVKNYENHAINEMENEKNLVQEHDKTPEETPQIQRWEAF